MRWFFGVLVTVASVTSMMLLRTLVSPMDDSNIAGATLSLNFVFAVDWSMFGVSLSFYNRFESWMRSWFVFDYSVSAVGFLQGVSSSHVLAFSMLVLFFDVVTVGVVHAVLKFVLRIVLENFKEIIHWFMKTFVGTLTWPPWPPPSWPPAKTTAITAKQTNSNCNNKKIFV